MSRPRPLRRFREGCVYSRTSSQQGQLERRARKRIDHRGRQNLDLAKAKRVRLTEREAYVHGSHPTPIGKYTQEEVDQLGREGKALAKGDESRWFPIAVVSDIDNAVAAYRKLAPSERNGVRAERTADALAEQLEWLSGVGIEEENGGARGAAPPLSTPRGAPIPQQPLTSPGRVGCVRRLPIPRPR